MKRTNHAGWLCLAAAVVLGNVAAKPAAVVKEHPPAPTAEARARLSEINVAIVLLSDRVLFSHPLNVRSIRSTMIEVSGTVVSAAAHGRALQLARDSSDLSIVDAMKISRDKSRSAPVALPAEHLDVDATHALMEPAFRSLRDLEVQVHDGEVTVLGTVACHEDRLAVSQRLQKVPGCRCVTNGLEVRRVSRQGAIYCPVTGDGRLVVAADPLPEKPKRPAAASITLKRNATPVTPVRLNLAPTLNQGKVKPAVYEESPGAVITIKPVQVADKPVVKTTEKPVPYTVVKVASGPSSSSNALLPLSDWYRQRIARECGLAPDQVQVKLSGTSDMSISFVRCDARVVRPMTARILQIPELSPYHVMIDLPR